MLTAFCSPGRHEWRPYRPFMDFHHFKHFYREYYFSGIALPYTLDLLIPEVWITQNPRDTSHRGLVVARISYGLKPDLLSE